MYFCFIDYAKDFDCVDHNKLWKILQEMGIPDHLTCLLRSLCTSHEATVRTGHGTMDWFKIGKGVWQDCITSPWLSKKTTQDQWCEVNLLQMSKGWKSWKNFGVEILELEDQCALVCWGYHNQIPEMGGFNKRDISHSSRGWEFLNQGAGQFTSW